MIESISSIQPVRPLETTSLGGRSAAAQPGFQDALQHALNRVEATGNDATRLMERFVSGEGAAGDLHTVGIAAQKAALQFETFLQMRNKVVQAYQEVMRMQL